MSYQRANEWERALLDDDGPLGRLRARLAGDRDGKPPAARFGFPRQPWQDQYWQATVRYPNGAIRTLGVCADDDERALDEIWKAIGGCRGKEPPAEVSVEPLQQPGRRRRPAPGRRS